MERGCEDLKFFYCGVEVDDKVVVDGFLFNYDFSCGSLLDM